MSLDGEAVQRHELQVVLKLRPQSSVSGQQEPHSKDAERFFDCAARGPRNLPPEKRGRFAQNDNFKVKPARRKSAALKAAALRSNLSGRTRLLVNVALRARVMPKAGADQAMLIGQPVKITQISSR